MISAADIRQELALLVLGRVSLNQFEEWIDQHVWDFDDSQSPAASDLFYSIQLLFSERNERQIDAKALWRELVALYSNNSMALECSFPSTRRREDSDDRR